MKSVKLLSILLALIMILSAFPIVVYAEEKTETEETVEVTDENCTGVYIGKAVSEDGTAIIARCADVRPCNTVIYLKINNAEDLSGKEVTGENGFKYTLPSKTYKYVSAPRPKAVEKGHSFDSTAINEKGLAVSATVTGYICEKAEKADPYVKAGISEDNIAGVLAACCDTARSSMELLAQIIDKQGSSESNIVMVADQNECWYMEIYSGHRYAAVRMPDNCVAGFGNEFMLDTLDIYNEKIVSEKLFSLPEEKGFAEKDGDSLNLFSTYAGKDRFTDFSNLRTWRVHNILAPSTAAPYSTNQKYPLFFEPEGKVSTQQVIEIFRDRLKGTQYEADLPEGKTRVIATETASQIHVLKVHPELPAEIAVEEWLCLADANYAPFVPISNCITDAAKEYTYVMDEYKLDPNSAFCIYKELNTLAAQDRTLYGANILSMWKTLESIWDDEYTQVLNAAAGYYNSGDVDSAQKILTNYCKSVQEAAIEQARKTTEDLLWYMMDTTDTMSYLFNYDSLSIVPNYLTPFAPLVCINTIAESYGWTINESEDSDTLSLSYGDVQITVTPSAGKRTSMGKITISGAEKEINAVSYNGKIYAPLDTVQEFFTTGKSVKVVSVMKYLNGTTVDTTAGQQNKFLQKKVLIPLIIIIVAIVAAVVTVLLLNKKKKKAKKEA